VTKCPNNHLAIKTLTGFSSELSNSELILARILWNLKECYMLTLESLRLSGKIFYVIINDRRRLCCTLSLPKKQGHDKR